MKLTFDHIVIENFKSFRDRHEVSLSEFDAGLYFLKGRNESRPRLGSNGAGKSSIWDALCWCLYGKTPRNLRNPDIRPRGISRKKKTSVSVYLTIDGDVYILERTTSPNSFKVNGETKDTKFPEKLVRMSFEVFTHTILFGQHEDLFFDLTPSAKMELFSEILDLDRWESRSRDAAMAVADLDADITKLEMELSDFKGRDSQVGEVIKKAKNDSDDYEANRQSQIETAEKELEEKRKRLESAKSNLGDLELELDKEVIDSRQDQKAVKDLEDKLEKARDEVSEYELQVREAYKEIKRIQEELDEISDGDLCPLCGQSIKETDIWDHKQSLTKSMEDLNKKARKIKRHELTSARQNVDECRDNLRSVKDSLAESSKKTENIRDRISTLQRTVSDLQADIRSREKDLVRLENNDNPYLATYRDYKKKRSAIKVKMKDIQVEIKKKSRRIERVRYWIKGFKDIRLYIIEDVVERLEVVTNELLDEFGLMDTVESVHYDVEKETKSGTVKRGLTIFVQPPDHDDPVRWESWSGGEGQRLRMIGSLALSEVLLTYVGVYPSLEILDEPSSHMSTEGVRNLCEYLADRARALQRQIWFTDHLAVESAHFTDSMTVVHGKDGSYIEGE